MTWSIETSRGDEAAKIGPIAVPYLQGRCLDLGCGGRKVWPGVIGMDNGRIYGKGGADIAGDIADLSLFGDATMDAVFSSHALEDFPRERVPAVLREWARVLKIGGFLVLYVPSGNLYPHIGEEGANPAHQWEPMPGDIETILRAETMDGFGWELVESEERPGGNEYSLFIVARKTLGGWTENVWARNPGGKKRALVCRFGAIGDQAQTSSVLPQLQLQGYHVTYCTTPKGAEVVRHDPHIDAWLIQDTDFVPNEQLGPYFAALNERYDVFINLCESIEGSLLALPNRPNHGYSYEVRRKLYGGVNYLERMHDIAGVPFVPRPRFYPTVAETLWASEWREQNCGGAPVILWAINGSSMHKIWPYTHIVIRWLTEMSPCHIVMTADAGMGKALQDGILECLTKDGCDVSRVHGVAGKWDIRETLTFAMTADCVVGPETGVLNAVSFEPMPKVIYLSHSSKEQLTRDWVNTTTLAPVGAHCYPCHQLHPDWTYCHKDEEANAALCASKISPERVFKAIAVAFGEVLKEEAREAAD